ncbi:P63C domain-containing protein (plasmid) [Nostoc sp. UHCC 0302]|uniref:P63C domain-containing protein n=1 Tax=Nostoc sp. UHCC 0302 TaxID=3134896 RepID=UPI00311CE081
MSDDILRQEIDGVEYFTIASTGESGMSQRGLSRLCGVGLRAVQNLLDNLTKKTAPHWLQSLVEGDLYLTKKTAVKGGETTPIKAQVCWGVLRYYERKGRVEAVRALDAIGAIGINSFIQAKTGWLPEQYQSSPKQRQQISRILSTPQPWTLMFESEFEENLARLSKLHKKHIQNGKYYWEFIYNWMTPEEKAKLDIVNPVLANGRRKHKIHQMLSSQTKQRLSPHVTSVLILMKSANSVAELRRLVQRQYGVDQPNLFDGWSLE